ncbi:glycosyltransferase [Candidatus Gracilibacteria bacterium]|nr:glycosyltransferase [Candidatus Gracilibacteria bacterium]
MKFAFVHCRTFPGGALNVFKDLIQEDFEKNKISSSKIFTLVSDTKYLQIGNHKINITTALPGRINQIFIYFTNNKFPILSNIFDYRNLIFFYPLLMKVLSKKIKKYKPDHITISSFAIAKNINIPKGCKAMLYLHSPMQYIRSHYDEYSKKIKGFKGFLFKSIVKKLRKWDKKFTKFDSCYSNSNYTMQLAKEIYGINCQVKYPKLNNEYFDTKTSHNPMNYYVYVGRLVNFVRESDLVIKLFNKLQLPLIVIGSGPDELYLKSIAGDNIIFTGRIEDTQERIKIIQQSKGLINLTKESFGLGTAEALLLGVPIFGYNQGATPELVDKESGILVDNKHIQTLIEKFQEFTNRQRNKDIISQNIRKKLSN